MAIPTPTLAAPPDAVGATARRLADWVLALGVALIVAGGSGSAFAFTATLATVLALGMLLLVAGGSQFGTAVWGTFNMCSFWLVEALTRAGRTDPRRLDDARLLFEQMLGYANHLGLYAEQTGPSGEALGNFPQAFTHLALISAAFNLDRALGGGAR